MHLGSWQNETIEIILFSVNPIVSNITGKESYETKYVNITTKQYNLNKFKN
jgi:hypothetical protein